MFYILATVDDIFAEFLIQFVEKHFCTKFAIVARFYSFCRDLFELSSKE